MSPRHTLRKVSDHRCVAGEGPVWDTREQSLYFVDLVAGQLFRHTPARNILESWQLPSMIGSVALREKGGAVVALQDGLHALDLANGRYEKLVDPQPPGDLTQFNDGKVDRRGRFIVGTQPRSLQDPRPLGNLYALQTDGSTTLLESGFQITNGPCWSPDNRVFYIGDSLKNQVLAYDYDIASGTLSNRRVFADTTRFGGFPDGATVDADGRLWVAVCLAGKIIAYKPDGTIDQVVDVPVRGVSSVMFGGKSLGDLYFTSLNNDLLKLPPDDDSGALFVLEGLGAQGIPEPRFAG